jgi:cation:H+ antiporter
MMDYILIIIGFVLLVVGANCLVNGAVALSRRFGISNLVIGLTVVAFGTSAPELVVNLFASINPDTTDIALTNIIGSNMINTYVILGAAALIFPVVSQKSSRQFDIPLSAAAPLLVFFIILFSADNTVSRFGAVLLLLIFIFFMYRTFSKSLKQKNIPDVSENELTKPVALWLAIVMIAGGLLMLVAGGKFIVGSATKIAESLGISQSIIGLTIVALGTTLPELATSVVAAFKKNSDIALGNVIGSNIFNVFFILGISGIIRPLPAYNNVKSDLLIVSLSSVLALIFVLLGKKHEIKRWQGALLLLIYIIYIVWTVK